MGRVFWSMAVALVVGVSEALLAAPAPTRFFSRAPKRSVARRAAEAPSYAAEIEANVGVLRRAAETKAEDPDAVVRALLDLEQAARARARADPEAAARTLAQLSGAWRLVFTTGTVDQQKRTGRVNYFPIKAVQTFEPVAGRLTNGVYFGDFAAVRFFGPMDFDLASRKLSFDFDTIELFNGALKIPLGSRGAAEIGAATGLGAKSNTKRAQEGKKAFFNWIDADDRIATARGGGGGLALWTRTDPPP